MAEGQVNIGDVIQITDPEHKWFPCTLIIDEPRSWGVIAYINVPKNDGTPCFPAYIRLENGVFEKIGKALVTTEV